MVITARIIEMPLIEVAEEVEGGTSFSYWRKDGKFLGRRIEPFGTVLMSPPSEIKPNR